MGESKGRGKQRNTNRGLMAWTMGGWTVGVGGWHRGEHWGKTKTTVTEKQ